MPKKLIRRNLRNAHRNLPESIRRTYSAPDSLQLLTRKERLVRMAGLGWLRWVSLHVMMTAADWPGSLCWARWVAAYDWLAGLSGLS